VRLVVLFGGRSAEHEVSRVSAAHVLAAVDPERYEVVPVGIDRDGRWSVSTSALAELGPDRRPPAAGLTVGGPDTDPLPVLRGDRAAATAGDAAPPTVVLPVLHGPNGEDGTVQGLLELADLPYVGSRVLGSALAMDKVAAKEVLAAHGIAQARFRSAAEWELDTELLDDIAGDLGLPLFVKPANMGSSVGVSKVTTRDQLGPAVVAALAHDELLVFEEGVVGRELEIGVLGNEAPRCSVPGEVVPAAEFYDYDDKYRDGAAQLIVPAALDAAERAAFEAVALAAFRALRCEGLARVDVFLVPGRGFLVNEVNTFPGFTPISMFPRMWEASGLSYPRLIDEMVRLALDRHARRHRGR